MANPLKKIVDVSLAPLTYPTTGKSASELYDTAGNLISPDEPSGGGGEPAIPEQPFVEPVPITFDPVAYAATVAKANTPQYRKNLAGSVFASQKIAASNNAFNVEEFNKYVESIAPGITGVNATVTKNIQSDLNFILPPGVQQAGITASAEKSLSSGVSGTPAASTAEAYYLTDLASSREQAARGQAMQLTNMVWGTTQSLMTDPTQLALSLFNSKNQYTMMTPAQAGQLELQKLQFNSNQTVQTSEFNSEAAFNNEMAVYNDYWVRQAADAANQAQQASLFGSIGSVLGAIGGGIVGGPFGAIAGGAAGGYLGSSYGGGTTTQNVGGAAGGAGTGAGFSSLFKTPAPLTPTTVTSGGVTYPISTPSDAGLPANFGMPNSIYTPTKSNPLPASTSLVPTQYADLFA